MLTLLACLQITVTRKQNRCMRHYFVEVVRHPYKDCEYKKMLLTRCKGHCTKSRTQPLITFSPILLEPFHYICSCCRDKLSIMKAVRLQCQDGEVVYATYRYIMRCGCEHCRR
uniref:CTCK domain-containing protein n=1 Tax=Octopus bimaculoides TaxID=37653 RepID=A0A0L8FWD5_OCTBM